MSVQAFINGSWTDVADITAPPGIVSMFAGSFTQVSGVWIGPNTGWLACNGQAVSRTTYAALFQAINTTWGAGDGVTSFNVPDLRESAPVGAGAFSLVAGSTRSAEIAPDVYSLGQFKDDQLQGHRHNIPDTSTTISGNKGGTAIANSQQNSTDPVSDGTNGTPRTGGVTRGKRLGVNFVVKT